MKKSSLFSISDVKNPIKVSLADTSHRRTVSIADAIPIGWLDHLTPRGRLAAGLDIATTENKKSNPAGLALTEEVGVDFFVRLLIRWKTADPDITRAVIGRVLYLLEIRQRRLLKLCIDATNERFFARDLKSELAGTVPVELVVSSESITYRGEKMSVKTYLGNLYVNTILDGHLGLPDKAWVADDVRLVDREKGGFFARVDASGNHADTFDGTKLSLHGLITPGGPAFAAPMQIGSYGAAGVNGRWKNPYAHLFENRRMINV